MASFMQIFRSDRAFCNRIHFAIMIKFRATRRIFPDTVNMERFLLPHQGPSATHLAAASAPALPKEQAVV
jgi:hypothetical protein